MCTHAQRRVREVIVRGYLTRQPYCRVCQVEAQRKRRARKRTLREAFYMLATMRWA